MIVTLTVTFLLTLELVRRGLEPECPGCRGKRWEAHSTQLRCSSCGWGADAK